MSAAVCLVDKGADVRLYEAAPFAGGRCRSYVDGQLGCELDNGNHLLLGANKEALKLIKHLGVREKFFCPDSGVEFIDIEQGTRWNITPQTFLRSRQMIPDAHVQDYIHSLSLLFSSDHHTVGQRVADSGVLYRRLWNPLTVSLLNTPTMMASATYLRDIMLKLFFGGHKALRPYVPKISWADSLIHPAIEYVQKRGAEIHYNKLVNKIGLHHNRITLLRFADQEIKIREHDKVILAVNPSTAKKLLPDIDMPDQHNAIINVHFYAPKLAEKLREEEKYFWGIVGGDVEWFFVKDQVISSTTSAANEELLALPQEELAKRIWKNLQLSLDIELKIPPYRVLTEKRATFSCTPEMNKIRPDNRTSYQGLILAGDYTNTGLPATIEGAIISGKKAASLVVKG